LLRSYKPRETNSPVLRQVQSSCIRAALASFRRVITNPPSLGLMFNDPSSRIDWFDYLGSGEVRIGCIVVGSLWIGIY